MAKQSATKRPGSDRRYDLPMIRDFLDHLLWEVRINVHEMDHGNINPELTDQLTKYIKKRQTAGLLFTTQVKKTDDPSGLARFRKAKGGLRKTQLECLELLQATLFPEAFDAAKLGRKMGVMQFDNFDEAASLWGQGQDLDDDHEDERPAFDDGYGDDDEGE